MKYSQKQEVFITIVSNKKYFEVNEDSEIYSAYKNRGTRRASRKFLSRIFLYRIDKKESEVEFENSEVELKKLFGLEKECTNLDYANEALKLFGYNEIYVRNPYEVILYFCLKSNSTYAVFEDICNDEEIKIIINNTDSDKNQASITFGQLEESLKYRRDNSELTIKYTQKWKDFIDEKISIGDDVKKECLAFIKGKDSTGENFSEVNFSTQYSINRESSLYYFRKYLYQFLNEYKDKIEKCKEQSERIEEDELSKLFDIRDDMIDFMDKDKRPFENLKFKHVTNDGEKITDLYRWMYSFRTVTTGKGIKENLKKEIIYIDAQVRLTIIAAEFVKLDTGLDYAKLNKKKKEEYYKSYEAKFCRDIVAAVSSKLENIMSGKTEVPRNYMCLIYALSQNNVIIINNILEYCGYQTLGDSAEDLKIKNIINGKIDIESNCDITLL